MKRKSRWLDAEELIEMDLDAALDAIENSPGADVEPVKHGRWIRRGNEMKCSNPKCQFIIYSNHDDFNYCLNCGTRMDGGNDA